LWVKIGAMKNKRIIVSPALGGILFFSACAEGFDGDGSGSLASKNATPRMTEPVRTCKEPDIHSEMRTDPCFDTRALPSATGAAVAGLPAAIGEVALAAPPLTERWAATSTAPYPSYSAFFGLRRAHSATKVRIEDVRINSMRTFWPAGSGRQG